MTVTEELGRFVHETATIAPELSHEGMRSIMNFVAAALAVTNDQAIETAVGIMSQSSGRPEASLIGRGGRLDAGSAAFVNALMGNLLDYDDTHLGTVIHPSAPVFPPALALAEKSDLSGRELLVAFVLGAEVECRIGNAVSPAHYARGWHITTTCGVFGAAAASAKLLGLDAAQTAHALGIAASQSAGVVENLATAAKNVSVGNSARNGILAALFARNGYAAAATALEGPLGWARASGDTPELARILEGLGTQWEFAKNTYKPYPCGIVMHSVIDACLQLRSEHGLAAQNIASVTVGGDALLLARGDRSVEDARDARVSVHHAAAAPLIWGRAGLDEFLPEAVFSQPALELRQRVTAELDPSLPPAAARVSIRMRDGRVLESTVLSAKGSLERPLSDTDLEAKLETLCRHGASECRAERIVKETWALATAPSVRPFASAVSGG